MNKEHGRELLAWLRKMRHKAGRWLEYMQLPNECPQLDCFIAFVEAALEEENP